MSAKDSDALEKPVEDNDKHQKPATGDQKTEKAPPPPSPPATKPMKPAPLMQQLWVWFQALRLVLKYSSNSPRLKRQFFIMFAASVARTGTLVAKMKFNEVQVLYQNSGQLREWTRVMWQGVVGAWFIAFLGAWHGYAEKSLALIWRDALTKKLHQLYFASSHFYQIAQGGAQAGAVVDADVRLTDDVPKLTKSVSNLLISMIGGAIDSGTFLVVLSRMGRTALLHGLMTNAYATFIYVMCNYLIIVDWAKVMGRTAATESALKQTASRAETHAEAICSLQGGPTELRNLATKWKASAKAKMDSFLDQEKLDIPLYYLITSAHENTPLLWLSVQWAGACIHTAVRRGALTQGPIPLTLQTPLVAEGYSHAIKTFWGGNYAMLGMFRILVSLHEVLQNFASIMRIRELDEKLQKTAVSSEALHAVEGKDRMEFQEVSIHTPSGTLLVDKLSFAVRWGESLLLTGQNGAGKSSIFRCMGGLWPIKNGSVWRPVSHEEHADAMGLAGVVYYLPQRPYNALGTLAEQFCYPDSPPEDFTEKELRNWLDYADLGYLADIPGALNDELDWENILSRGEQQRLAIIRLFWRRPRFAVLDECTSAVSGEMERRLFDICPRLGISCITIAHRPALLQYHQQLLTLTGKPHEANGGWMLSDIPNGAARFDPLAATSAEAGKVVDDYLAMRDVKLKGARLEETKGNAEMRKAKMCSGETASTTSPKSSSRCFHPDLFIGLKQPGAGLRIVAAAVCLCLRTHVVYLGWKSLGDVISSCLTFNFGMTLVQAVSYNIQVGLANLFLDRVYKRCVKRLSVMLFEGFAEKAHGLMMTNSAMHYAKTYQLVEDVAARAGEIGALSSGFEGFMEGTLKQTMLAFYGAYFSIRNQGWPVIACFLINVPFHGVVSKYLMPDYNLHVQKLSDLEAKFKTVHTRFRQNLEPIAFSSGGRAEQRIIERRFDLVTDFQVKVNREEVLYQTFTTFLTSGDLLPLSFMRVLSMYYTYNNTKATSVGGVSGNELADMWRFDRATTMVFSSMGSVLRMPEALLGLAGVGMRLSELAFSLEEAAARAPSVAPPTKDPAGLEPCITAQGIDIITPKAGEPLALGLSFKVDKGNALVVTGPNASGKSLLGAYIAGLRPLCGATPSISVGNISVGKQRPHMDELFRIPQRPYLAPGGLGDQVAYPLAGSDQPPSRLQECLDLVGIGYLVERHGGLDKEPELPWDEILSGGEQQRIGVARCLFHRPVFGILDECTSMVSQETELGLYKTIVEGGTIPITISQRLSLPEMHGQELQLGIDTVDGWKLSKIEK